MGHCQDPHNGVSTTATFFESETPIAYIDRNIKRPFIIGDYKKIWHSFSNEDNPREIVIGLFKQLASLCDQRSAFEKRWLYLYFRNMLRCHYVDGKLTDYGFFFAKMPLPQAHLYLEDPLLSTMTVEKAKSQIYSPTPPEYMVKVDFAFWAGERIVAVEIDGSEPEGYERDIKRDRRLRRAGVDVIHILNNEIKEFQSKTVTDLLPKEIGNVLSKYELSNIWSPELGALDFLVPYYKKSEHWIYDDDDNWDNDLKWFDEAAIHLLR